MSTHINGFLFSLSYSFDAAVMYVYFSCCWFSVCVSTLNKMIIPTPRIHISLLIAFSVVICVIIFLRKPNRYLLSMQWIYSRQRHTFVPAVFCFFLFSVCFYFKLSGTLPFLLMNFRVKSQYDLRIIICCEISEWIFLKICNTKMQIKPNNFIFISN